MCVFRRLLHELVFVLCLHVHRQLRSSFCTHSMDTAVGEQIEKKETQKTERKAEKQRMMAEEDGSTDEDTRQKR